ncbi:ATPase, T2SS/T4P/T4SS family [Pantoea sp. 1.19]|uniref:ATPase, T2SS/T4P/T4SS family n=1 Tax=Pantoea sp. 1.19 TaxID=1925589 RepID=UPI00094899DB|nr:ATPase, T2SS/T4P/T4SS family [Pantoea sp. 1.19]
MSPEQATLIQQVCQRWQAEVIDPIADPLRIAVAEGSLQPLLQALRFVTDQPLDIVPCSPAQLAHYAQQAVPEAPSAAPIATVLDDLLETALVRRASDMHIEPQETHLQIRLRVDGVLHALPPLALAQHAPLLARLKILAGLDIAERRLPQDGQFSQWVGQRPCAFRLATLPTRHGEKAAIRLLESRAQARSLANLGMPAEALACFQAALARPQGMILVTGPTGSGKTFTLYSALQAINTPCRKVCSVEDPVEMPVAGLNQTQTHAPSGLDFQRVLRALLRQDPDVIMVGEIRDAETADIALKAAQTGHLVLSTLHTNSTTDTLIRLRQMGIPGWLLATSLRLIIAQRLVRRLCPHCRHPAAASPSPPAEPAAACASPWIAPGCERCYSGFYGRLALFEILPIDARLQQAIAGEAPADRLADLARQQGMRTLYQAGEQQIALGETTLAELHRAVGLPDDDA